jgi:nucleotide-binding universal stress UspA family protein
MAAPASRIVCATDFSDNARSAAEVAAAMAVRLGAELELVHVADEAHAYTDGTMAFRAFLRPFQASLKKEVERLRGVGAKVQAVLLHGKWAEIALVEYLEKAPPLLVVVSSVSKTAFDRWTIGSVSERISQQSPVPTLVVRNPQRLLAWTRRERPLKIMVAADFTLHSDAALAWIKVLRDMGNCAVTVAHINWPPAEHRTAPSGAGQPLTRNLPSVKRQLRRDLREKVAEVLDDTVEVQVQPNWGRPDAALVHMAIEGDADLIVIGTHQRHGLSRLAHASISRGVLRHAPMSVACVPAPLAMTHGVGHRHHIRRVLVATDFSVAGDQAIPWAYAMLGSGGVLKLMHVLDTGIRRTAAEDRRRIAEARDKLAALVPGNAVAGSVETELDVTVGSDPALRIRAVVAEFGPDVICLGSRGHSLIAETVIGSVARAVMDQNRQPVLLVRPTPP